jgi:hypothetical protein
MLLYSSSSSVSSLSRFAVVPAEALTRRRRRRRCNSKALAPSAGNGKTVTTNNAGKEVYVHIDCDNVRPRFNYNNNNAENNDATRFISAFYRCASAYGDVVSMTCYGNSSTFREEEEGRGDEEEEASSLKKYRQSLGEALERVHIEGTDVRVVRTLSRRKQSADVRCLSDVVNAMRGGGNTCDDDEDDDENTPRKIAFIASKDAGLLKEAASAYVRKMGDVIVCGDFINVGMREIDVHPIEAAYRELVEEKIGASGGGQRIKGRPASEALAIRSRLVAWKDPESVFFYASDDEDNGNGKKNNPMRKRRRREDPYLFMIPGPSSSEACENDCVRGLPASIQPDMRDIIARYRKREESTNRISVKDDDDDEEESQLYKLLKREAKKNLRVRSNPCFAHASEVLVYFDAGPKLGAVFAKWLENGDLEMLCR